MTSAIEGSDTVDVCIIGSGPAGAVLAAFLGDRGHEVVVLDAGRRFDISERVERMEIGLRSEYSDTEVWEMGGPRDEFTWTGDLSYDLNTHRIKGIGGTSLHWGGVTPRLHPEDFEMESRYGLAEDWPVSYGDLEPYYLAAEKAMGVSGTSYEFSGPRSGPYPLPAFPSSYSDRLIGEACEALDIELHPVPRAMNSEPYDGRSECLGYGTCQIVCPSMAKYDASVHIRKAEERGVRVIDRAPVERLELDETGNRVAAAVYTDPDGTERRQRARYFVVACGAVESPRLLLQSATQRHPDGLGNSSGMLGRNLMFHPAIKVRGTLDRPTRQNLIGFSTSMTEQFYDYGYGPEGSMILMLSNTAGPSPAAAATSQPTYSKQLLEGDLDTLVEGDLRGDAFVEEYRDQSSQVAVMAWVEQLPDPANRVSLDYTRTDDQGDPVPELTWRLDDRSTAALRSANEICQEILEELGATDIRTSQTPERPLLLSHRMGTTRMGTDPDRSVVNPHLRTHDLVNLYISSSGVFVTAGAANPTLTIVALTIRLAEHLHHRLSSA